MALRISDLARSGGVGVETVRFYQRRGLLAARAGNAPGVRHYDSDDVRRLRFIRQAKVAGFSLAEIAELIELDRRDDRERAREMARSRIIALDKQIEVLRAARASLSRLEAECARTKKGPCPILAAFDQR